MQTRCVVASPWPEGPEQSSPGQRPGIRTRHPGLSPERAQQLGLTASPGTPKPGEIAEGMDMIGSPSCSDGRRLALFKDTGKITLEFTEKIFGKHRNPVLGVKHVMDEDLGLTVMNRGHYFTPSGNNPPNPTFLKGGRGDFHGKTAALRCSLFRPFRACIEW